MGRQTLDNYVRFLRRIPVDRETVTPTYHAVYKVHGGAVCRLEKANFDTDQWIEYPPGTDYTDMSPLVCASCKWPADKAADLIIGGLRTQPLTGRAVATEGWCRTCRKRVEGAVTDYRVGCPHCRTPILVDMFPITDQEAS